MDRDAGFGRVEEWGNALDVLVIGGGATGLGVGVDAASRGFRTLVVEQSDFGKGTSSRSTKLVHGGVRYLKQGNLSLVLGALRERELLWKNAPYLVHPLGFVLPTYSLLENGYYRIGLKCYDLLAGGTRFGRSKGLSSAKALEMLPGLKKKGLCGGVQYFDGQFDDARMVISLAQTIFDARGVALNYCKVQSLVKDGGKVRGAVVLDLETGRELLLKAKVVVNATGVFTDEVRRLDESAAEPMLTASQGVHIVVESSFLNSNCALMVPKTSDGRVLFAIPWQGRTLIGTTDSLVNQASLEPRPLKEEIDFLLEHAGMYLERAPSRTDILSTFAGLRPLVKSGAKSTAETSRDHTLLVSSFGLVTITGGKWTTYRKMAEQTVDRAIVCGGLENKTCVTKDLKLHGWTEELKEGWPGVYGSEWKQIEELAREGITLTEKLHPRLPYLKAEVIWAVRKEMARNVEDILARRTRGLFQDAKASIEAAPEVAKLMAAELDRDEKWASDQTREFEQLAKSYLPGG